jgi:hypothetical protein
MKVYIGPHKKWIGPYQIAYALCFWVKKVKDEECGDEDFPQWVHEFGTWLAEDKNGNDSLLAKFCLWVDKKRQRKVKIHIDNYDTWNMGDDLAMVILPMLKQLKATKHGSPYVDLEDVPENLRTLDDQDKDPSQKSFDFYEEGEKEAWDMMHERWEWVIDEMIWAFEQVVDEDNDSRFYTGVSEMLFVPIDKDGNALGPALPFGSKDRIKAPMYKMIEGPNHTHKYDRVAHEKHQNRIDNGLRLFGKYYQGLWN